MSDQISKNDKNETLRFVVGEAQSGLRLDKALSELADDLSRSRIQGLIEAGALRLNGLVCTEVKRKVAKGHIIEVVIPPLESATPQPENIPLQVVYEDADLLVINKPAGLVVHPGAGNWSGTLVNALLYHCDDLSGIGGVERPGIVHRLDKETSGLMVVAKNDKAHKGLSEQLEDRSLHRVYEALVLKVPVPVKGVVDMPIGRDARNRLKQAVNGQSARTARTHYLVKENYKDALSLVECRLESGRTHQIRVHMQAIKHPLIGDPLYGPQDTAVRAAMGKADYGAEIIDKVLSFPRQALHAGEIAFLHPISGKMMEFTAERPDDFSKILKLL